MKNINIFIFSEYSIQLKNLYISSDYYITFRFIFIITAEAGAEKVKYHLKNLKNFAEQNKLLIVLENLLKARKALKNKKNIYRLGKAYSKLLLWNMFQASESRRIY